MHQDDFYKNFIPTKNIYYNINLKKLWDDWNKVPNGYFITKDDNSQKYEVVDECEHFYYKKTVSSVNYYYCTSECKTIILEGDTTNRGLFFVNGRKNCEYSCTEFNLNKLYYNPDTNECLETCKGLPGKEFADKIDTTLKNLLIKSILLLLLSHAKILVELIIMTSVRIYVLQLVVMGI